LSIRVAFNHYHYDQTTKSYVYDQPFRVDEGDGEFDIELCGDVDTSNDGF
jgi:hypothetical protein